MLHSLWACALRILLSNTVFSLVHFGASQFMRMLQSLCPEKKEWFTEGQAYLRSYDSAPRPPPSSLSRQQVVSLSQFSCVCCRSNLQAGEEGKGRNHTLLLPCISQISCACAFSVLVDYSVLMCIFICFRDVNLHTKENARHWYKHSLQFLTV